jgi:hypothetical protein
MRVQRKEKLFNDDRHFSTTIQRQSYQWLMFHATKANINVVSSEGLLIKSNQGQQVNE